MYGLAVFAHSAMRWVVIAVGVTAVGRALTGQAGKPWTAADGLVSLAFIVVMDLQLLAGMLLFVFSPITILGRHELDLAARSHVLRFFTFTHPIVTTAAVALAHIGYRRIRRLDDAVSRRRTTALWFGSALLLVVAGTPWPFLPYGRPLLSWPR